MADEADKPLPSRLQKLSIQILFFLRFIQLGSTTLTGFIFCFLVWHHNNHYCADYPKECSDRQRANVKVPWAEILMITACSASFLEAYISSAFALFRGKGELQYKQLVLSTSPIAVVYLVAYRYYYDVPTVAGWCYYNQNQNVFASVELRNCAIVNNAKVSGGIAGAAITLIAVMSVTMIRLEQRWKKARLGESSVVKVTDTKDKKGAVVVPETDAQV